MAAVCGSSPKVVYPGLLYLKESGGAKINNEVKTVIRQGLIELKLLAEKSGNVCGFIFRNYCAVQTKLFIIPGIKDEPESQVVVSYSQKTYVHEHKTFNKCVVRELSGINQQSLSPLNNSFLEGWKNVIDKNITETITPIEGSVAAEIESQLSIKYLDVETQEIKQLSKVFRVRYIGGEMFSEEGLLKSLQHAKELPEGPPLYTDGLTIFEQNQ